MPDVVEKLEELPQLVVETPTSPEVIRQRARRRIRRRRLLVGGPVAVVAIVLVTALVVVVTSTGPDEARVITVIPTTTSVPTTTSTATLPPGNSPSGLRAEPVVDLADGESINVFFDDPSEVERATFVAVCDGEVIDRAYLSAATDAELLAWCGLAVTAIANPTPIRVGRLLDTPNGRVDCAANVGRCVVAASLGRDRALAGVVRWSPIGFRPVDQADPTIEVSSTVATDGTAVVVSGTGGLPGQTVMITQCLSASGWRSDDITSCDTIRDLEAPVGDDGRFEAQFILYREILTYSPDNSVASRWTACEPCFLIAARSNGQGAAAAVAVDISARGPAIHPLVEIVQPGPHAPGQPVTLRGTGFQADGEATALVVCSSTLMSEPFNRSCAQPVAAFARPGAAGTFTVADFVLPDAGFSVDGRSCVLPGQCALGSVPSEGLAYLLSGPLDLSG
jgi:hypothetical protein